MSRPASSSAPALLWFACFAPPAAWFASLVVSYFAVHEVCRVHSALAPRVVSLAAFVLAAAAGIAGRAIWTAAAPRAEDDLVAGRTRFMAQIAVLASAVFSLIIVLQILATLLLPSCHERPRTPESPDVLAPLISPSRELVRSEEHTSELQSRLQ